MALSRALFAHFHPFHIAIQLQIEKECRYFAWDLNPGRRMVGAVGSTRLCRLHQNQLKLHIRQSWTFAKMVLRWIAPLYVIFLLCKYWSFFKPRTSDQRSKVKGCRIIFTNSNPTSFHSFLTFFSLQISILWSLFLSMVMYLHTVSLHFVLYFCLCSYLCVSTYAWYCLRFVSRTVCLNTRKYDWLNLLRLK